MSNVKRDLTKILCQAIKYVKNTFKLYLDWLHNLDINKKALLIYILRQVDNTIMLHYRIIII